MQMSEEKHYLIGYRFHACDKAALSIQAAIREV